MSHREPLLVKISMPASGAVLLLNAEAVFTALIAWFVFRENFDRRIALGMALIVAGAVVLSWQGEVRLGALLPVLAVLGACLAWGVDNNLTRKVSLSDAGFIAIVKGLAAGAANTALALLALRHLGADRRVLLHCAVRRRRRGDPAAGGTRHRPAGRRGVPDGLRRLAAPDRAS